MRQSDLFDDGITPLKVAFWCQPHHWSALVDGLGADESEALRQEYRMILAGHRDVLGHPCLCADKSLNFAAAVKGGQGGAHDSMGSIVGLAVDLKRALEALPLSWKTTRRVYWVQRRAEEWLEKVAIAYTNPRRERLYDRMPDLGTTHAYAWMAYTLGWRGSSKWPKRSEIRLRPLLEQAKTAA